MNRVIAQTTANRPNMCEILGAPPNCCEQGLSLTGNFGGGRRLAPDCQCYGDFTPSSAVHYSGAQVYFQHHVCRLRSLFFRSHHAAVIRTEISRRASTIAPRRRRSVLIWSCSLSYGASARGSVLLRPNGHGGLRRRSISKAVSSAVSQFWRVISE